MSVWEIILIGIALSMDAVAVGMTNGMTDPKMAIKKMLLIAFAFGAFQFLMPVLGYYCSYAFAEFVSKIAPWLSFALLGFLGGKMIFDFVKELREAKRERSQEDAETESETQVETETTAESEKKPAKLGIGKLLVQAVATSIDALAVGVTLLAAETQKGLPFHVLLCALVIGVITFSLSLGAVFAGKRVGNRFADKAALVGGLILVGIGLKILIESFI